MPALPALAENCHLPQGCLCAVGRSVRAATRRRCVGGDPAGPDALVMLRDAWTAARLTARRARRGTDATRRANPHAKRRSVHRNAGAQGRGEGGERRQNELCAGGVRWGRAGERSCSVAVGSSGRSTSLRGARRAGHAAQPVLVRCL